MDNSKNLSNAIFQSNESSSSNIISNDGLSFFDSIKSINFTLWLIVFLILAFLGFNIFNYLGKGTEEITNFFSPLIKKILQIIAIISGQTIDVSAEGAKAVVGGTATTLNTGLTAIQNITPNKNQTSLKSQTLDETSQNDISTNNTLNKA